MKSSSSLSVAVEPDRHGQGQPVATEVAHPIGVASVVEEAPVSGVGAGSSVRRLRKRLGPSAPPDRLRATRSGSPIRAGIRRYLSRTRWVAFRSRSTSAGESGRIGRALGRPGAAARRRSAPARRPCGPRPRTSGALAACGPRGCRSRARRAPRGGRGPQRWRRPPARRPREGIAARARRRRQAPRGPGRPSRPRSAGGRSRSASSPSLVSRIRPVVSASSRPTG